MKTTIRWCDDIGMFAYDRGIPQSCIHATDFCKKTCYNNKLYKLYPNMKGKDERNNEYWNALTPDMVKRDLAKRKKQTKRVRLMTRGEAFRDLSDIAKVKAIAEATPGTDWWIPTRAWRSPILRTLIIRELFPIKNIHVLASLDPSNTDAEWEALKLEGWSTVFFGNDDMTVTPNGDRMFLCPKTHKGLKGHCAPCKAGCFGKSIGRRVDVHLSKH